LVPVWISPECTVSSYDNSTSSPCATGDHKDKRCIYKKGIISIDGFRSIFSVFTMATGGHYITMLLADCMTWSIALQFLWWKMLWNLSIASERWSSFLR